MLSPDFGFETAGKGSCSQYMLLAGAHDGHRSLQTSLRWNASQTHLCCAHARSFPNCAIGNAAGPTLTAACFLISLPCTIAASGQPPITLVGFCFEKRTASLHLRQNYLWSTGDPRLGLLVRRHHGHMTRRWTLHTYVRAAIKEDIICKMSAISNWHEAIDIPSMAVFVHQTSIWCRGCARISRSNDRFDFQRCCKVHAYKLL